MVCGSRHICPHHDWLSACAFFTSEAHSMAVRTTPYLMLLVDLAWNEIGWTDYAAHFSDDLVRCSNDSLIPLNKGEHLVQVKRSCETVPDNLLQINPCSALSASQDGNQTCALGRPTGTALAAIDVLGKAREPMMRRRFDVPSMRTRKWSGGWNVGQHRFFDMDLMLRQLGK